MAIPVLERSLTLCQEGHIALHFSRTASLLGSAYAHVGRMAESQVLLGRVEDETAFESEYNQTAVVAELSEVSLLMA